MNTSTIKNHTLSKSFLTAGILATTASACYIPAFILLIIRASKLVIEKTISTSLLIGISLSGAFILYRLILAAIAFFINTWRFNKTMLLIADAGAFLFPFGVFLPYLFFSMDGYIRWLLFALLLAYGIIGFILYLTLVGFFREYALSAGYSVFFLITPFLINLIAPISAPSWIWLFAGCIAYLFGITYSYNKQPDAQYLLQIIFTFAGVIFQTVALFIIL